MKKISLLLLLLTTISLAQDDTTQSQDKPTLPTGFIYGAGSAYKQQVYQGFSHRGITLPLLGYVGEKLYVVGPFANYAVMRQNDWEIGLDLAARFNGYDTGDSDFFAGMQERKDSLDAGFSVKYKPNQWNVQFKALTDVLSKSDGSELELNLSHKFKYKYLSIEPGVALSYLNQNLVDYYYGVKTDEATSTRSFYQGSSTTNQSLKLSLTHPIPIGFVRLDIDNTWYGSGITDSSLVDDDQALGVRLFFVGYF